MANERSNFDITKVLQDFHEQYISDPHPRPTSAPPELFRLSKENLFAFSPEVYIRGGPTVDTNQYQFLDINALNSPGTYEIQASTHRPLEEDDTSISLKKNLSFNTLPIGTQNLLSGPDTSSNLRTDTMDSLLTSLDFTPSILPLSHSLNNTSSQLNNSQDNSYTSSYITPSHTQLTQHNYTLQNSSNISNLNYDYSKYSENFSSYNLTHQHSAQSLAPTNFSIHGSTTSISNNYNYPSSQISSLDHLTNQNTLLNKQLVPNQYHNQRNSSSTTHHSSNKPEAHPSIQISDESSFSNPIPAKQENSSKFQSPEQLISHKSGKQIKPKNTSTLPVFSKTNSQTRLPSVQLPNSALTDLIKNDSFQGHVLTIAKDQASGRMLQNKLDDRNHKNINIIFDEVINHFPELMIDPFANYLCQKLMEVCSSEQLNNIIDKVSPELVNISLNKHGTRAVQKLISMLSTSEQIEKTIKALSNSVTSLVKNLNGNHVIQKCLSSLLPENCNFIYSAIVNNCLDIARHCHGCCVLQRCIDASNTLQKKMLIKKICEQALQLVRDQYGNYVVQYILNLKDESTNGALIDQFSGQISFLSKHKCSSNVVEKCLSVGTPDQQKKIINELLSGGPVSLKDLLLDPFANYVVQRALKVAKEPELEQLLTCIRPNLDQLQQSTTGAKLVSKLKKMFTFISQDSSSSTLSAPTSHTVASKNTHSTNDHISLASPAASFDSPIQSFPQLPRGYMNMFSQATGHSDLTDRTETNNMNFVDMSTIANQNNSYSMKQAPHTMAQPINQPSYGNLVTFDQMHPNIVLSEHIPQHNILNRYAPLTPVYSPSSEQFVNPLIPAHAYPNHPTFYFPNEFTHPQASNYFSPAKTYLSGSDMHLISSPPIMSIPGSYNKPNIFSRMTPLNLNPAYPTNASSAGWA